MRFTVILEKFLSEWYRLQLNGEWRQIESTDEPLQEEDAVFDDVHKTNVYTMPKSTTTLNGETIQVNSGSFSGGDYYSTQVYVHRDQKPRLFAVEEVREAIRRGNDNQHNSLIITLDGYPQVVKREPSMVTQPYFAVRNETTHAGNGYVGEEAAQDSNYVRNQYRDSLQAYLTHIETGKVGIYTDGGHGDVDKLIERYNAL